MKNDNNTKIEELKTIVKDFCEERDWDQFHSPKEIAIGAVTEASELLEHFRFLSVEQVEAVIRDEKARAEIGDELADVLFFLVRFSQKYDFDLSECFARKMKKNAEKYPTSEFKGKNNKKGRVFF